MSIHFTVQCYRLQLVVSMLVSVELCTNIAKRLVASNISPV